MELSLMMLNLMMISMEMSIRRIAVSIVAGVRRRGDIHVVRMFNRKFGIRVWCT